MTHETGVSNLIVETQSVTHAADVPNEVADSLTNVRQRLLQVVRESQTEDVLLAELGRVLIDSAQPDCIVYVRRETPNSPTQIDGLNFPSNGLDPQLIAGLSSVGSSSVRGSSEISSVISSSVGNAGA